MSSAHTSAESTENQDPIESLANVVPVVLPVVGGLLIFLLAFIAVYMA